MLMLLSAPDSTAVLLDATPSLRAYARICAYIGADKCAAQSVAQLRASRSSAVSRDAHATCRIRADTTTMYDYYTYDY